FGCDCYTAAVRTPSKVLAVVGRNIERLRFAGTFSTFKGLFCVFDRQGTMAGIVICLSQARVGHGEIGIQFESMFIKRDGSVLGSFVTFRLAQTERLQNPKFWLAHAW